MSTGKKHHYYVLVITDFGPKFVTKVNYGNKTAEWDFNETPLEMSKSQAEYLVLVLNLNMCTAYLVKHPVEIDCHPYKYDKWKIMWKERKEGEE